MTCLGRPSGCGKGDPAGVFAAHMHRKIRTKASTLLLLGKRLLADKHKIHAEKGRRPALNRSFPNTLKLCGGSRLQYRPFARQAICNDRLRMKVRSCSAASFFFEARTRSMPVVF